MQKWSERNWYYMLVYQGVIEAEFEDCNASVTECFTIFTVSILFSKGDAPLTSSQTAAARMETLVNQKADEMRALKKSQDADRKAIMDQLAGANFMKLVLESKLKDNQNELKMLSGVMQKVRKL